MARRSQRISESELEVLKLLWDESPLGAADLVARAPAERKWSPTTVRTLLARLVEKGAVTATGSGRRFLYRPALERETLAAGQAGSLVDRLFGGRISPLVAQLAEQRDIDPKDLEELEALVRRLRK